MTGGIIVYQQVIDWAIRHLPDAIIYTTIVVVTLVAMVRCYGPVRRNTRALRRATRIVLNESKQQAARPSWNDLHFLGDGLQSDWARFLQNAELMDAHGEPCDVEEYINADTAIYNATNAPLADLVPGVLVSLGILGTFLGIVLGLSGLDVADASTVAVSMQTLLSGMSVAFLTSIFGIVGSLCFNFGNRYTLGHAQSALTRFVDVFQQYAMPRPVDNDVRMLALQQEQNSYLRVFVEEISLRMATQMEQAILRALLPVQRSMDNFIVAATREQVEGMDRVATRFVERLDLVMDGQFMKLGDTLAQINASNQHAQADMQTATAAISTVAHEVMQLQQISQDVLGQMQNYLADMEQARKDTHQSGAQTAELLGNMHAASVQQAKYLTKLQEYQAALQNSLQQYTTWTDKYLVTAEQATRSTNESLARVATDMQDSATLLQSSYTSFVENIQAGLARALSMLDENISGVAQDLNTTLSGIYTTVSEVPNLMATSARKYGNQVEQFVDALSQLQKGVQGLTATLTDASRQREVN